jgi:hypothetical protein
MICVLMRFLRQDEKTVIYTMQPLSQSNWDTIRTEIERDDLKQTVEGTAVEAEDASIHDATKKVDPKEGIVIDANRELRVKLYMGQVSRSLSSYNHKTSLTML